MEVINIPKAYVVGSGRKKRTIFVKSANEKEHDKAMAKLKNQKDFSCAGFFEDCPKVPNIGFVPEVCIKCPYSKSLKRHYSKKIENCRKIIKQYFDKFGNNIFVGFSGGKDSIVLLDLVLSITKDVKIVFNPKDDIHPQTVKFVKEVSKRFDIDYILFGDMEHYITNNNLLCQFDGSHKDEFERENKSTDFIVDGKNVSRKQLPIVVDKGMWEITFVYPLQDLTDKEVISYIKRNKLPYSKEYKW